MNDFELKSLMLKLRDSDKLPEILNISKQQGGDLLSQSSPEIMKLVDEYARLAALRDRSEQENDRLETLLNIAKYNDVLSFWMTEVDHLIGHYLGLLEEDDRESYKDQQASLWEYLGTEGFPTPTHKQIPKPTYSADWEKCSSPDREGCSPR